MYKKKSIKIVSLFVVFINFSIVILHIFSSWLAMAFVVFFSLSSQLTGYVMNVLYCLGSLWKGTLDDESFGGLILDQGVVKAETEWR